MQSKLAHLDGDERSDAEAMLLGLGLKYYGLIAHSQAVDMYTLKQIYGMCAFILSPCLVVLLLGCFAGMTFPSLTVATVCIQLWTRPPLAPAISHLSPSPLKHSLQHPH